MVDRPRIAVIGCGYWGSKHVRVLSEIPHADIALAVDFDQTRLNHIRSTYPGVPVSTEFQRALSDETIDGVILATPISSHFSLAMQALSAGKHVLVEKPLAQTGAECRELIALAKRNGVSLMVGHTFQYHPAVLYLRELVNSGQLGKIHYIDCARLNLGLYQPDANVLWDLAPHDLSILTMLLEDDPNTVSAWGSCHRWPRIEDVIYVNMTFPTDISAHLHVSWLDPCKVRRVTIVGSNGMVVFNDGPTSEKIRIYDKRFEIETTGDGFSDFQSSYHQGNVVIPPISGAEPLKLEVEDFVRSIITGEPVRADGEAGLRVVEILETASRSLIRYALPFTRTVHEGPRLFVPLTESQGDHAAGL
jgi:predicted dehydrogenase